MGQSCHESVLWQQMSLGVPKVEIQIDQWGLVLLLHYYST